MDIFSKLPEELKYLAEPASKYGRFQFYADIDKFLESASDSEMAELTEVAERYGSSQHDEQLQAFLDHYPITDYEQSAELYFLFLVIDAAGIEFETADCDNVEHHMESLKRFGSTRLASERMHAAKFLADFGTDANPAIPLLLQACTDEDHRVRVWANYALLRIDSNHDEFMKDIRSYLGDANSEVRTEAAAALGAIGPSASMAIPDLVELINNQNEDEYDVGIYMESMVAIGKQSPIVKETLLTAAKSDNQQVREDAKEFLDELEFNL